jgi:hypothetical protein
LKEAGKSMASDVWKEVMKDLNSGTGVEKEKKHKIVPCTEPRRKVQKDQLDALAYSVRLLQGTSEGSKTGRISMKK